MCACDTVKVNPSSLVMIHKCWSFIWGAYNAEDLRKAADVNDAWDKSQVSIYRRKTGLSETVLLHMMADTTYMTGKEAVEKALPMNCWTMPSRWRFPPAPTARRFPARATRCG